MPYASSRRGDRNLPTAARAQSRMDDRTIVRQRVADELDPCWPVSEINLVDLARSSPECSLDGASTAPSSSFAQLVLDGRQPMAVRSRDLADGDQRALSSRKWRRWRRATTRARGPREPSARPAPRARASGLRPAQGRVREAVPAALHARPGHRPDAALRISPRRLAPSPGYRRCGGTPAFCPRRPRRTAMNARSRMDARPSSRRGSGRRPRRRETSTCLPTRAALASRRQRSCPRRRSLRAHRSPVPPAAGQTGRCGAGSVRTAHA